MPNYVVLDAIGNGNCLFNSFAIHLAHQVCDDDNNHKLLERIRNPYLKQHYIDLANALLPKINEHRRQLGQPELKALTSRSRAATRLKRFEQYFAAFQEGPDKTDFNWISMQLHLAPLLRDQVVNKCKKTSPSNTVLNVDGRPVQVSELLQEVFQSAIAQSVLGYPMTRHIGSGGYFQDHPTIIAKMKELFEHHNFDFGPYDDPDARPDENKLKADTQPIIEDLSHWFFKEGIEDFYHHRTHGLAQDKSYADQFALQMLSSLYDIKIAVTRAATQTQDSVQIIEEKNKNLWFYEHRFFTPGANQEIQPDENDLIFHFRSVPGHWQLCLPSDGSNETLAKLYANQKDHYINLLFLSGDWEDSPHPKRANSPNTQLANYQTLMFFAGLLMMPLAAMLSSYSLALLGIGVASLSLYQMVTSFELPNEAAPAAQRRSSDTPKEVFEKSKRFTPSFNRKPKDASAEADKPSTPSKKDDKLKKP